MSNSLLLVAILLLLVAEPLALGHTAGEVVLDVLVAVVLISAVRAVSQDRRLLIISVVFVVPALVGRGALYFTSAHRLAVACSVLVIAFLVFTAVVILRRVLGDTTVTADTIAGALCVYLLLGVVWAGFFSLSELAHPGSFLVNGSPLTPHHGGQIISPELLYLSLITLSTVGYGDIVAVAAPARMLAALEAIVGQLYLAVLIARLVSLHVPRSGGDG